MDQRNKVIIFTGIGLLILAVIFVSLFYFLKSSKISKIIQPAIVPNSLSRLPNAVITSSTANPVSPTITFNNPIVPVTTVSDKILQGQGFSLSYPRGWGLLTCSNSNSFEFDPSGVDMKNVVCDLALKPVTFVVVSKLNCGGDPIKLGNNYVNKTKIISSNGDISYRWCTAIGNTSFDITHRVSQDGSRATSKVDLSQEVEKIITSLNK